MNRTLAVITAASLLLAGIGQSFADYNIYGAPVSLPTFGSLVVSQGSNTGVTAGVAPTNGASLVGLSGAWTTLATQFTASGCSNNTLVGGAQAGTFKSGVGGTCTVVITINGAIGATAPNGWACSANDRTTTTDIIAQTASTTSTATLSGTTVSGDVISFQCVPY